MASSGVEAMSQKEVITRLIAALAGRVSPYSGDTMVQYCMRILGSMLRPTGQTDLHSVGHRIQRALRQQGGDWRRYQDLQRRLAGFRLFSHKAYVWCTAGHVVP